MNTKPTSPRALPDKGLKSEKSSKRRILVGTLVLFLISTLLVVRYFDKGKTGASAIPNQEEVAERAGTPQEDDPSLAKNSTWLSSLHPLDEPQGGKGGSTHEASPLLESSATGEAPLAVPAQRLEALSESSGQKEERVEWVLVSRGRFNGEIGGVPGQLTDVTLTYDYYVSKKEVTIRQFRSLMPDIRLGPFIKGVPEDAPVTHLSWEDATEFCGRLSKLNGEVPAGYVCRLPTEAEWEHACRMSEEADRSAEEQGAESEASEAIMTEVLSGMQRDPAEWCLDGLKFDTDPVVDPLGRVEGPYHSLRGVRARGSEANCSARHVCLSSRGIRDVGFRPVLAPDVSRLAPVNRP